MALKFEQLLTLAKTTAKASPSAPTAYAFGDKNYGYSELNDTLRNELQELAPDYRTYKINEARQKFAKKYADKYHLNYEYTPTWRPSIALSAKGGVLDVSKYAAKDNDRLIKSILKVIDNNVSLVRGLKQHREPQVKILK